MSDECKVVNMRVGGTLLFLSLRYSRPSLQPSFTPAFALPHLNLVLEVLELVELVPVGLGGEAPEVLGAPDLPAGDEVVVH